MKRVATYRFSLSALVFLFVTLVTMNSVQFIPAVELIGTFGKLVVALIGIAGCGFYLFKNPIGVTFRNKYLYGISYLLILFFAVYHTLTTGNSENLLFNLVFPIYFLFYFLLIKALLRALFGTAGVMTVEGTKLLIFRSYRAALLVNTLIWFALAMANSLFMYDAGGFGGFFEDKIHFGLFAATGFLVCLYLRLHPDKPDRSWGNLVQLALYATLVVFTSRNAMFICGAAVGYYFLLSRIKSGLYIFLLLLLALVGLYFQELFLQISPTSINELSTGRFEIWRLTLRAVFEQNILWGSGLFNLNAIVLQENVGTGFYYLDTLDFLYFHSSYLEILAAGGLVVLIFFMIILLNTWPAFTRLDKTLVIPILWGGLVESYLVQPFFLISSLFYFLLLASNCRIRVKRLKPSDLNP